jgi:hypothetical protein
MPRKRKTPPDGRANNGGRRVGQPGQAYANRSDLTQAPRAAPGQTYGAGAAQTRAQQAVPLPQAPPPAAGGGAPAGAPLPGWIRPDDTPTLGAPTSRPDEPLEAGLPFGPGRTPAPTERPPDFVDDDLVDRLRALYQVMPTRELAELIDQTWVK